MGHPQADLRQTIYYKSSDVTDLHHIEDSGVCVEAFSLGSKWFRWLLIHKRQYTPQHDGQTSEEDHHSSANSTPTCNMMHTLHILVLTAPTPDTEHGLTENFGGCCLDGQEQRAEHIQTKALC